MDREECLKRIFQEPLKVPQKFNDMLKTTFDLINQDDYKVKKKSFKWFIQIAAMFLLGLIVITGIAYAVNIGNIREKIKDYRGLGKGVDTAIENGYIEETNMDYAEENASVLGEQVDNVSVQVRVDSFLMDDYNVSTEFSFIFGEELEEYISFDRIQQIDITDFIVIDEENRIISAGLDKEAFENYCNEYGLEYTYADTESENFMNTESSCYIVNHNEERRTIGLMYNVYSNTNFPKSQKLKYTFHKIRLTEGRFVEKDAEIITLLGNWEIEVDVPENMYNRSEEYYKVVSCSNKDFEVYASKVSETGFEIGLIINNIEKPSVFEEKAEAEKKLTQELREKYNINPEEKMSEDVYRKYQEEYNYILNNDEYYMNLGQRWLMYAFPIDINGYYDRIQKYLAGEEINLEEDKFNTSYLEDENGEKYYCTHNAGRRQKSKFQDGNRFDFYDTFTLTKFDATDSVKAMLYYYGEYVTIELEKIK